jgi:hypothetical protein
MDMLIAVALLLIAVAMLFNRPINIVITHKYVNPPLPETPQPDVQKQADENTDALKSMDAVIKALHEIMGVNGDDNA